MYIRSLSEDATKQQQLDEALYHAFEAADYQVDTARVNEVKVITETQKDLEAAQDRQQKLFKEAQSKSELQKEALEAYKKQLNLIEKLNIEKKSDDIFVQLKELIAKERKIYKDLGSSLLASKIDGKIFHTFIQIINMFDGRFNIKDDNLQILQDPNHRTKD